MTELHLERLPKTIELNEGATGELRLRFVDQRKLPYELALIETGQWREVIDAIKTLAIRGAPAIGLAGASALALWASLDGREADHQGCLRAAAEISQARPTAVNLMWAVNRAVEHAAELEGADRAAALFHLVKDMEEEDEARNRAIGVHGARLLQPRSRVLTHCNAGSLATFYYGTALGVVYAAAEQGKIDCVYVDETRPVGQGARLTAWELSRVGVPATLLCDNMAASLMAAGNIDAVIVGADRIAANGDAANKIGTYGVAVLAHEHGIPFYVAAPTSTIDVSVANGSLIPIEQRNPKEVLLKPLEGVDVYNPAFDVTPARYITAIITENGVFAPDALGV